MERWQSKGEENPQHEPIGQRAQAEQLNGNFFVWSIERQWQCLNGKSVNWPSQHEHNLHKTSVWNGPKVSRWAQKGPKLSKKHLGLPFRTALDPFGPLWNVDKPAMFGHFYCFFWDTLYIQRPGAELNCCGLHIFVLESNIIFKKELKNITKVIIRCRQHDDIILILFFEWNDSSNSFQCDV